MTNINKEIARIITDLYDGKKIVTDAGLLDGVGSCLETQVFAGFGKDFSQVDFGTPDAEMLTRLSRDTWQFSAAKNYQQLRDMTLALKDESGKLRSFSDYREQAGMINEKFNKNWLKTEYNLAVNSSTMAARWNDFKKGAKDMPYLRYVTAGDERVRDSHRALDGIIRKITDDFWKTYYPPNGYGCRCDVEQLPGSSAVETGNIPYVPLQPLFKTNLATSGLVYPKGHAYYNGVPKEVLRKAIHYLPPDAAFKKVYTSVSGKTVEMHLLHGSGEMAKNVRAARYIADNGHNVKLLPVLPKKDNKVRKYIYGTDAFIKGSNPDILINKQVFEIKVMEAGSLTHENIGRNIKRARLQADNIFIVLPEEIDEKTIKKVVVGKQKVMGSLKKVWIKNGNNLLKY